MTKPQAILSSDDEKLVHARAASVLQPGLYNKRPSLPLPCHMLVRFAVLTLLSSDRPRRTHMIMKMSHSLLFFRSASFGKNWKMGGFAPTDFFSREVKSLSYGTCALGKSRDFLTPRSLLCPGSREHSKMCMNGPPH